MPVLPFGEFLPDLPDLGNPGATVATNVLPAARSYKPFPGLVAFSNAVNAYTRGAIGFKDNDLTVYNYAGTGTKLYSLTDDTWADVTRSSGGDYATPAKTGWEFAIWDRQVIAVNGAGGDAPQVVTVGGANFAALTGSPPKASHIAVVRDFVVLGNVDNAGTIVPNRIRWSGINDETSWAVSAATQADFTDLKGTGGHVQRITGGEYGLVFQERSVWRMTYVNSPTVFQLDEILPGRGTPAPGSVARLGDQVFFLSQDGFEVIVNGSRAAPIGANKVDNTFWAEVDADNLDRVSSAVDPKARRVYWAYPGPSSVSGRPNRILCYDWSSQRWSRIEVEVNLLYAGATSGYTLDGLDSVSTSLDALTESLDSRVWTGGNPELSAFDENHKLGFFTGTALAATVETAEAQLFDGRRALLSKIRPVVDGGTITVQIRSRNKQTDTEALSSTATVSSYGTASIRKNARYHRARINITGDFTDAIGIEVEASPAGPR